MGCPKKKRSQPRRLKTKEVKQMKGSSALKSIDKKMWVMIVVVVLAMFTVAGLTTNWFGLAGPTALMAGVSNDSGTVTIEDLTASVTLTLERFTGEHGNAGGQTPVTTTNTVVRERGNSKILNDVSTNSTTSVVLNDVVSLYGTGSSFYVDPVMNHKIEKTADTIEANAYTVVATTDLVIECYQKNAITALTADDNANNTADYAGGALGAGEDYKYFCQLTNNVADKTFRLGAILTGYCGDEADEFELLNTKEGSTNKIEDSEWKEATIPSGNLKNSINQRDDVNASTGCSWKHAYVPKGSNYVDLHEWDYIKSRFNFEADDTTGPTANGDTYIAVGYVDYGCERDLTGDVVCSWYRHNTNGDPADVGIDESIDTTMTGLDVAVTIEPQ